MRTEKEIQDKLDRLLEMQDRFGDMSPIHHVIKNLEWVLQSSKERTINE